MQKLMKEIEILRAYKGKNDNRHVTMNKMKRERTCQTAKNRRKACIFGQKGKKIIQMMDLKKILI